jgi:hypothetical protein
VTRGLTTKNIPLRHSGDAVLTTGNVFSKSCGGGSAVAGTALAGAAVAGASAGGAAALGPARLRCVASGAAGGAWTGGAGAWLGRVAGVSEGVSGAGASGAGASGGGASEAGAALAEGVVGETFASGAAGGGQPEGTAGRVLAGNAVGQALGGGVADRTPGGGTAAGYGAAGYGVGWRRTAGGAVRWRHFDCGAVTGGEPGCTVHRPGSPQELAGVPAPGGAVPGMGGWLRPANPETRGLARGPVARERAVAATGAGGAVRTGAQLKHQPAADQEADRSPVVRDVPSLAAAGPWLIAAVPGDETLAGLAGKVRNFLTRRRPCAGPAPVTDGSGT